MSALRQLVVAFGCVVVACASAQQLTASPATPGTSGTVKVRAESNGNTTLAIAVQHLPPASTVVADSSTYVVWVTPRNAAPQNVGALQVDKNYAGSLETMTPHQSFELLVTPEPSAQVLRPSHEPVFTAQVDRR